MEDEDQQRSARCAAGFISFAGTKETNQRKCLPRQGEIADSLLRVISRLGILPRLETACIHARRPPGLGGWRVCGYFFAAEQQREAEPVLASTATHAVSGGSTTEQCMPVR